MSQPFYAENNYRNIYRFGRAKLIPMDEIPHHINDFNKDETYYIICAAGSRSARVQYLEERYSCSKC